MFPEVVKLLELRGLFPDEIHISLRFRVILKCLLEILSHINSDIPEENSYRELVFAEHLSSRSQLPPEIRLHATSLLAIVYAILISK